MVLEVLVGRALSRDGRLIMVGDEEVVINVDEESTADDSVAMDGDNSDNTGNSASDGTRRGDSLALVPEANDTAERGRAAAERGRDKAECGRDRVAVGVRAAGVVVADVC